MVWGAITPTALILILIIVILLFGTSRLRNIGADLGEALKNFRKSVKDGESKDKDAEQGKDSGGSAQKIEQTETKKEGNVYQGEVVNKDKDKQG